MTLRHDERGVALVLALFALVVIGALVGTSFFSSLVEQQSGRSLLYVAQAREAAEAGLSHAIATTDPAALAALAIGAPPLSLDSIDLGPGVTAHRDVVRVTGGLFLIRAHGLRRSEGGAILAARSLGGLIQLVHLEAGADSASGPGTLHLRRVERGWIQLY